MNVIDERYQNGKIYKIVCNETGEVYYGSTIQELNKRMYKHRCDNYCRSRHIIDRNNYYYELIEDYSCNNKKELETREKWYILNNDCINQKIPARTKQEWKENISIVNKNYRKLNREILLEKAKEKMSCDICGSIVRKSDIARHRRTKKCLSKIDG